MLSAGKFGRSQERYYLDKVAEGAEDYYSGEGEAQGQWLGGAAEDLGLSGVIEPKQLVAMLTGHNPASGDPLGLRHVQGGAVPGFDLTFSAPKSVSVTWALAGPPVGAEVKAAHAAAVQAGLDYEDRPASSSPSCAATLQEDRVSSRSRKADSQAYGDFTERGRRERLVCCTGASKGESYLLPLKRRLRLGSNRKRPSGEEGRFWGYYREERYVSLYMCGSVGGR